MAAPDLSTREAAFAHLKSIILEFEAERAGTRRRPQDREFRERRLEIAVTLLYAEMIARSRPELADEAEVRVSAPAAEPAPRPQPRPDVVNPPNLGSGRRHGRNFVQELMEMAA